MGRAEIAVSVIIPVYNVQRFLRDCVDSVLNSVVSVPFEIILVDDGSTDGSEQIADEYTAKDERIRVLHQRNSGLSAARNRGIQAAKGSYLFFLDSDDLLEKDYLERLYQKAEQEDSDVAFGGFTAVSEDLSRRKRVERPVLNQEKRLRCGDYLRARMDSGDWNNEVWCGLYRRSFLKENDLFFLEDIRLYEDIFFTNALLLKEGWVTAASEYGYLYRIRRKSLTHDSQPNQRDIDGAMEVLDAFVTLAQGLSEEKKRLLGRVLFQHISMLLYYIGTAQPKEQKALFQRIRRREVMDILKKSAISTKDKVKYLIFRWCMGAYYPLVRKEGAGEWL